MIGEKRDKRLNVALNARPVVRHKLALNSGRLILARKNATRGCPLRCFALIQLLKTFAATAAHNSRQPRERERESEG